MKRILLVSLCLISQTSFAQNLVDKSNGNKAMATMALNPGINCTSQDKRITIYGSLPGDSSEADLEIKIDGKSFRLRDNGSFAGRVAILAVNDIQEGVFTVAAKNKVSTDDQMELSLYAIPKSMSGEFAHRAFRVRFDAQMKFFKRYAACNDGCITLSMEAEKENKDVFEVEKLSCLSGNF